MTATKLDLVKVEDWGLFTDTTKPIIIAGPCSAESEQQVFETAKGLKAAGVEVLRAGIWKPRTRPNCFEGVGSEGLVWMKRVQRELGMKISTEVANVKHVYEALKAGVDMLWIGARTSANPFAMQEIADALKGTDIPVLVKNPVNPDVELWIGALERLNMAGLKKIGVIHRGFSAYVKSKYRNVPQWQLPIEIKRRFPDMLMICDPSHISGKREYIQEVSQQAMDLGFDGLIIESHICPEIALSDAAQQVTPTSLREILGKLIIRDIDSENIEYKENIDELRAQIDDIDNDILELLTRRMKVSDEIGKYKKQNNITILQPGRWDKILEKVFVKGAETGLDNEFLEKVFKGSSISYKIESGKQVVLTLKSEQNAPQKGDKKTITGVVSDRRGEPLIGVTVRVEGENIGTATDIDGRFSLEAPVGAKISFSYIGYVSQSHTVNKQNIYNVSLSEDSQVLEEVVVVGYGFMKRKDITTAVSVVSTADIEERPIMTAAQAIQGKAAGIQVAQEPSDIPALLKAAKDTTRDILKLREQELVDLELELNNMVDDEENNNRD